MSQDKAPQLSPEALCTEPVSRCFGLDRGTSICRHYLQRFLAQHAGSIRGRVLEVGDNAYTLRYGAGVSQSNVLNAVPSPNATLVGDLASGAGLPRAAFDCIILTQTIQCIYDFKSALRNAYQSLRPGGVLLLSASGISQISRYDMDRWGEFWRFTDKSLRLALKETCPGADVTVTAYGNVAAAKGYLDGLCAESFPEQVLDVVDADYQMVLTASVTRPAGDVVFLVPQAAADGWTDLAVPGDLGGLRAFAEANRHGRWRVRFGSLTIHCLDLLAFHTAVKDIFLQGIYDFPAEVAHPVVIDGGAHIGLFTLRAKALHPGARVLAFEPDPSARDLLRRNCEANGLTDVEIIPAGLFDREGALSFTSKDSDGSSLFGESPNAEVRVTRLSPWLEQTVDMLKLNIEGAEYPVLLECGEALRRVRCLALEYHGFPNLGDRLHQILDLLHERGFRYAVHDFDRDTNPATKPPFAIDADTRYYLLVWGTNVGQAALQGEAPATARPARRRDPALARELAVVVRGVGERTTTACLDLLRQELPEENISLLREIPFSRAVRGTYERGLAARRPWVLALDADMLLRPGALAEMVAVAQAQPETVFTLWTLALDFALRVLRPVGMHLYRASLLREANLLTGSSGYEQSLRPESTMVECMLRKGYQAAQTDIVVGLHDYCQAHRDLAKKGFLHARKHPDFVALLRPKWGSLAEADPDYRALAAGADLGLRHQGAMRVDDHILSGLTAPLLDGLRLPEKPSLDAGPGLAAFVKATLAATHEDAQRLALQARIFPEHLWRRLDGGGA